MGRKLFPDATAWRARLCARPQNRQGEDLVAADQRKVAEVTHFQIARSLGDAPLLVPYQNVKSVSPREIILEIGDPKSYVREPSPDEVLLRDYLLDKKVLDIEDREVEVVYDIRLAFTGGRIYVVDVDISRYGLLVRMGMKGLAAFLHKRAGAAQKRLIPWSYMCSPCRPSWEDSRGTSS